MDMENPKQLTPEEIAEMEKSRTISDAELLKGGAEYVVDEKGEKNNLLATEEQKSEINNSYEIETRRKKLFEKDLEDFRNWVNFSIKLCSDGGMGAGINPEHSVRYVNGSSGEIVISYDNSRCVITDLAKIPGIENTRKWMVTIGYDNQLGIDDLKEIKALIENALLYHYQPKGKYYNESDDYFNNNIYNPNEQWGITK